MLAVEDAVLLLLEDDVVVELLLDADAVSNVVAVIPPPFILRTYCPPTRTDCVRNPG